MRRTKIMLSFTLLIMILSLYFISGCSAYSEFVDGYIAVVPKTFYSGEKTGLSISLFRGNDLTNSIVELSLRQEDREVFNTQRIVFGKETVEFQLPSLPEGRYEFVIQGNGFSDKTTVLVEDSFLVFLQTDKPIYKPGQTMHIRVITLNSELKPVTGKITIEAMDAKGIKVLRKEVTTDEYGMASLDLPLSTEPNLGTWKLVASSGKQKTQLDVRVEKYVLPKYEVKLETVKDWFLPDEPIKGEVYAEYSFKKPVIGEVEIKASRYVGKWEQYARVSKPVDGKTSFEIPPVGYVSGVPGARGMGNIQLDIVMKEKTTGYEEKINRLITIAPSSLVLQLIPESAAFKPSLPFKVLVIAETPDNKPREASVKIRVNYLDRNYRQLRSEEKELVTTKGKGLLTIIPEQEAVSMQITASAERAMVSKSIGATYSPTGNFIQLEQVSEGIPKVGEQITFQVHSTRETSNFYYEVIARGRPVFSDFTRGNTITFQTSPLMAPSSRILVYQILPNSEMAADDLPFKVTSSYPHNAQVSFTKDEVKPGEEVAIDIKTQGQAKVGLQVVDRSVFILAENRLNLQQVFDEMERLYMKPQVELHSVSPFSTSFQGARETFENSGLTILTNKQVPSGAEYKKALEAERRKDIVLEAQARPAALGAAEKAMSAPSAAPSDQLAEVQRVRQFFPETWLWRDVITDTSGKALLNLEAPDSISTWKLYAVALSKDKGLGIAESELKTFQPFFISIDLPYSAIRGETFPVKVAVYNYLNEEQEVLVEMETAPWLELLDQPSKNFKIGPNDIGGAEFKIRPTKLGLNKIKISARSRQFADAAIKSIIIEPEGVEREVVENLILSAGSSRMINTGLPQGIVEGSGRVYLAFTGSYLTQTIEGLENLLRMPFGCGEQNMILLAPNIFVTSYLKQTGQLKPEIMAKAEQLMLTGYQRQLTYRRHDKSFSAFGNNDKEGSLWLTAFVVKTFAQAKGLIYIDPAVLEEGRNWIIEHQRPDGSFEAVGFVAHQEMMGGIAGKDALTAYMSIALLETGDKEAASRAIRYLEGRINNIDSPYTMALTTYALALANSSLKDGAYQKLLGMASQDENGLYWSDRIPSSTLSPQIGLQKMGGPSMSKTTAIEATGYALLALNTLGDRFNASRAARWLTSQRNAYGGFGSTQDTVVSLQALTDYARTAKADVDIKIAVAMGEETRDFTINSENAEVLQIVEVPFIADINLKAEGKGDAVLQVVKRYNLPQPKKEEFRDFEIQVNYDTTEVAVNDKVKVSAQIEFNPAVSMQAEMVVLDVSIPTGFAAVNESIEQAIKRTGKIQRYDIAGRKVIFYIVNMLPGEKLGFTFEIQALYPVRAQATSSQVYSYYKPELKGETLSRGMIVNAR